MKKILFLITIIFIAFLNINVYAKDSYFYTPDYISDVWMNKKNTDGIIYYNQASIYREAVTQELAYCMEPYILFDHHLGYTGSLTPVGITDVQKEKINLLAHFGYSYKNHTDKIWAAVTQQLIWKELEPSTYYYYSTRAKGFEVEMFQQETKELIDMVENYRRKININGTYDIAENNELIIEDNNLVNNYYKIDGELGKIEDNKIIIPELSEGTYEIKIVKNDPYYFKPTMYFQNVQNQDLFIVGDPEDETFIITINVYKTELNINKIDKEKQTYIDDEYKTLKGTEFTITGIENNYNKTITIDNEKTTIDNIPFGKYILKEIEAGNGYQIDNKEINFEINKENTTLDLTIENEPKKTTIIIEKEYEVNNQFIPEENIIFNIYQNNEIIESVKTNIDGIGEIKLPYGKYAVEQLTTTEGYTKIDNFNFEIKNDELLKFNLKNYKISVPNTYCESSIEKNNIYRKNLYEKKFNFIINFSYIFICMLQNILQF